MIVFWLALIVAIVGVAGGIGYGVVTGLVLWRRLKQTGKALTAELDQISRTVAQFDPQLARAAASRRQLGTSAARLQLLRKRLAVQTGALQEAQRSIRRALWFVPGV